MKAAIAQFTSKSSSAGIVNVELGFIPDFAILIQAHGGTNPNLWFWHNNDTVPDWAAALGLLLAGSSGIVTRDTASLSAYAGGDTIAAAETTDTAGKHVNLRGLAAAAGHVTAPGIAIPADHQTASGANILLAFQFDAVPVMQPAS